MGRDFDLMASGTVDIGGGLFSYARAKRALDAAAAALLLAALAPLLVVVASAIVATSGWGPLYAQRRVGRNGGEFTLWKFRSMVRGADDMRSSLLHLNEAPFPAFKIRVDPRVTPLGRFLRRSSIDELPQLWNVLRGEMSLVGPRPPLPDEVARYEPRALRRLAVRPGLTGLWQVRQRHTTDMTFDQWVDLDIEYVAAASFGLDLRIIAQTVVCVLRMTGS